MKYYLAIYSKREAVEERLVSCGFSQREKSTKSEKSGNSQNGNEWCNNLYSVTNETSRLDELSGRTKWGLEIPSTPRYGKIAEGEKIAPGAPGKTTRIDLSTLERILQQLP